MSKKKSDSICANWINNKNSQGLQEKQKDFSSNDKHIEEAYPKKGFLGSCKKVKIKWVC